MNTNVMTLEFLALEVPTHWHQFRCEREGDDRVLWMRHNASSLDGGFLEVRTWRYKQSRAPKVTAKQLLKEVGAFTQGYIQRWLGSGDGSAYDEMMVDGQHLKMAAASFDAFNNTVDISVFLRVWQVSDGRHFAIVLYTSEDWMETQQVREQELRDCESVVDSLKFK